MKSEPYHKIITAWERDPATKYRTLIEGRWATPEFAYLAEDKWTWTEKVDGTNIRIHVSCEGYKLDGKTDAAQIPAHLIPALEAIGARAVALGLSMTLYGEGYGAKIQKGGGNYIPDGSDFVLFDVRCGGLWLARENVEDIAGQLSIQCVPVVGHGTLFDAVEEARVGRESRWGEFEAEGFVMRPAVELMTRRGERIITKIKHRDFQRTETP